MQASGRRIQVCEGTAEQRDRARAWIKDNDKKGCVIAPLTAQIIRRLNITGGIDSVWG